MVIMKGFRPVGQKRKPLYDVKYCSRKVSKDSFEYQFLFSSKAMVDCGWRPGDYVQLIFDSNGEVVGFSRSGKGEPFARKLTVKDKTRTGAMYRIRGNLSLPKCNSNTVLEIANDQYQGYGNTLIVKLPEEE